MFWRAVRLKSNRLVFDLSLPTRTIRFRPVYAFDIATGDRSMANVPPVPVLAANDSRFTRGGGQKVCVSNIATVDRSMIDALLMPVLSDHDSVFTGAGGQKVFICFA